MAPGQRFDVRPRELDAPGYNILDTYSGQVIVEGLDHIHAQIAARLMNRNLPEALQFIEQMKTGAV